MKHWIVLTVLSALLLAGVSLNAQPLEKFIYTGTANSPLLKDLRNRVKANAVDSQLVRAGRMPQIGFNGLLYYAPVVNGYGYSEVITNIGNLTGVVNVSQELFNKKTAEAKYASIGIQNQSISNEAAISVNDLRKAITDQYLEVYSLYAQAGYAASLLASLNDEDQLLSTLVQNGIYKQTDYLAFLVEKQSLELGLNDLRVQYRAQASALKQLCGIGDTAQCIPELPDLQLPTSWSAERSPLFNRFRIDSLRILSERTLIDRDYKPKVSWFSDAGVINNQPSDIYKNFGLSLGMSLSLPIYDGNRRQLNYTKLKLDEETRQGYQSYFQVQHNLRLDQLRDELKAAQEMIPGIRKQLTLAETIVKQEKELLNTGEASVTIYVLALKNLVNFNENLTMYEVKVRKIVNEILYLEQN